MVCHSDMATNTVNNGGVAVSADASIEIRPAFFDTGRRGFLILTNSGAKDAFIAFGEDAVVGQGTFLKAAGGAIGLGPEWQGSVNAICVDEAGTNIAFSEGVEI